MSNARLAIVCAASLFVALPFPAQARDDDTDAASQALRQARESPEEASRLALSTHSPYLAGAALQCYLKQVDDASRATSLQFFTRLAQREDWLNRVALVLSLHKNGQAVIDALAERQQDRDANRLAAAIALHAALGRHLDLERGRNTVYTLLTAPPEQTPGAEQVKQQWKRIRGLAGAGQNKGGKKRKSQRGRAAGRGTQMPVIPESLLQHDDEQTRAAALLAAAYAKDSAVTTAVEALDVTEAKLPLAAYRILYYARTEHPVTAEAVQRVFEQTKELRDPVTEVTPELATYDLLIPGLCALCQAIAELEADEYLPVLYEALRHEDLRVQMDAARALCKLGRAESVKPLAERIGDCEWPVLVEACAALGRLADPAAIRPLVERLNEEKGRLRLDLVHALSRIAGEQKGEVAAEWVAWWRENRREFEPDTQRAAEFAKRVRVQDVRVPQLGFFYGLPIYSEGICYVVDASASMKGAKIASLKENLTQSIEELEENVKFNLVDFGGHIEVMRDGGLIAKRNRSRAVKLVQDMDLTFATRSHEAMEAAVALPGVDSMYFLSDGAPAASQLQNWTQIATALAILNRYRPVAMFAIDFDPSPGNKIGMCCMADENWGLHESVGIVETDADETPKRNKGGKKKGKR